MIAHRVNPSAKCPACDTPLRLARGETPAAAPRGGDFSVCIDCGQILRFDDLLLLELIDEKKLRKVPRRLRRQLKEMSSFVRQNPR